MAKNQDNSGEVSDGASSISVAPEIYTELILDLHRALKAENDGAFKNLASIMNPLIVTGYQGLPLLEVAKFLAKSKLCQGPCLGCLVCYAVDKETSIHLKIVRPEGKAIKVDQVRDVIDFLSYKKDHMTVVIFDQAHLMNLQAANALLKTLEEPPENCWIVLTSPSIKNMLSTIRSRCLVYKSKPLNFGSFKSLDAKLKSQLKSKVSLLQGRWDWMLNSEEVLNGLSEVKLWLKDFQNKEEMDLLDWMKSREGLQELITYLRLLSKQTIESQMPSADGNFNSLGWIKYLDRLQNLELALNSNVDIKLVEDHLFQALKEGYVFH